MNQKTFRVLSLMVALNLPLAGVAAETVVHCFSKGFARELDRELTLTREGQHRFRVQTHNLSAPQLDEVVRLTTPSWRGHVRGVSFVMDGPRMKCAQAKAFPLVLTCAWEGFLADEPLAQLAFDTTEGSLILPGHGSVGSSRIERRMIALNDYESIGIDYDVRVNLDVTNGSQSLYAVQEYSFSADACGERP